MNKTIFTTAATALAFAFMLGISGPAAAHMMGQQNMSPEQYKAMQDTYTDFGKKIEPLRQQLFAKQAELNDLYAKGTPQSDAGVQALLKDLGDLDAKMYAARADLRGQLIAKGVPMNAGMGHGMMMGMAGSGCPMMAGGMMGRGMGHGMGHGMGYGMMGTTNQ